MSSYSRLVFIGVGGGWRTPRDLAFFLSFFMPDTTVVIVDGGFYQSAQLDHEHFDRPGNKARVQAEYLRREFPHLRVEDVRKFVGTESSDRVVPVGDVILDGDVVFLQADNNKTRRLVEDRGRRLSSVTVICGGTNGDQLRVMVHARRDGKDLTPPFSEYCDEIAQPADESPAERSPTQDCLGQVARAVQQPFTMLTTSTLMANVFYEVWKRESAGRLASFPYRELWYDIGTGRCRIEGLNPGPL